MMHEPADPTIVIVPGLRDHVADHWQTLLAPRLRKTFTVPRMERDKLSCDRWVQLLDESLSRIEGPVVLVAHSAGVLIVVHWAHRRRRSIKGALLATPADLEQPMPEGYPTNEVLQQNGWLPIPRMPLPFPSIVAGSTNDPLGRFERVEALARAWDSRFVDLGSVGHLNPAAGFGEWRAAEDFIRELSP